ncbi:MAG: arginine--tRNA ligase [Ruminococcaceae bacterium]|nr:arginine--tRNA ligase [Oscillospiraceae bacterium]
MSKLVKLAEEQIISSVTQAIKSNIAEGTFIEAEIPNFKTEIPADRKNGDYSANAAFMLSKALRMPPRKIAEGILEKIDLADTYFSKCEVAGPGFINFFLKPDFYADILLDVEACGDSYGKSDFGNGKKINVEFVSANPTGPMHMGNARGGALGDCLAAVLDWAGYYVEREFYVNDAGNQIDKFALSLDVRYQQILKGEDFIELPEDSYHGDDIRVLAQSYIDEVGDGLLDVSESERRKALVDYALPKNIEKMKAAMAKYRINYNTWFSELTLHNGGELLETIEILKKNGHTYEKDGALWYKNIDVMTAILKREGKSDEDIEKLELKDDVLIRQNGNPTYFAADIAYHRNKLEKRGFDTAIDVWGADHHGHVARMKGAMEAVGIDGNRLDVVLMQLVNLMKDGKPVKMSKRTGKAITLVDLLDEVPIDAVRFLFNMREAGSAMDFDLDLAVEQSNQNPVYYCQYAHARICSILKKLESEGITARMPEKAELTLLSSDEETDLIAHLAALTGTIVLAAKSYDPAKITHYATDLATKFHRFYNAQRVMVDDEALMQARIFLCKCVRNTMKNVLSMLCIEAPESM